MLEKLDFLDTEVGMSYCADMEDIYQIALEGYVESDLRSDLITAFANEDWDQYRISAHAVKSTSLTIGAAELSEFGKTMEYAARDKETATIMEKHADFLTQYGEMLDKINAVLASL